MKEIAGTYVGYFCNTLFYDADEPDVGSYITLEKKEV